MAKKSVNSYDFSRFVDEFQDRITADNQSMSAINELSYKNYRLSLRQGKSIDADWFIRHGHNDKIKSTAKLALKLLKNHTQEKQSTETNLLF
jgi:hypothetical protein